jgi:hypothetical protein
VRTLTVSNLGNFVLLVDDDSEKIPSAYIAYDILSNLDRLQIEQITPDFTATLGKVAATGPLLAQHNEASILFKRHGYYYFLFGECCCFCAGGDNFRVFVSTHALGPFNGRKRHHSILGGQESFVAQTMQSNSTLAYIFVSNRWGTGALKSHDMQHRQPM